MKLPTDTNLATMSYHAEQMAKNAHAVFWLESRAERMAEGNTIDSAAEVLRRDLERSMQALAGLCGCKLTPVLQIVGEVNGKEPKDG